MNKPNHKNTTMLVTLTLLTLSLMTQNGYAYQFKVGASGDWSLASASSYDHWAQKCRFQSGDTLWFSYKANDDSVLQVSESDYKTCNTTSPIAKYSDGHTMIKLNQSGPHYFISGVVDHCKKNEKVMIIVLADRTKHSSPSQSPSPSAAPPPADQEYHSPPPAPAAPQPEMTPSPAPSPSDDDSHPPPPSTPSGASFIVANFVYSVGAFVGFSFLF